MRLSTSPITLILSTLFLLSQILPAHAARPPSTSFCKCICFNNSTIIALNPPQASTAPQHQHLNFNLFAREEEDSSFSTASTTQPSPSASPPKTTPHHRLTCADCNRAFCLSYTLPACDGATEADVFTTCFQRDSLKDESVVFIFIFATAGLLGWALLRPFVNKIWARQSGDVREGSGAGGLGASIRGARGRGQQSYTPIGSEPRDAQGRQPAEHSPGPRPDA